MEKNQVGKGGQGWGLVGLPVDTTTSEDLKEVSSRPCGHLGKGPRQRERASQCRGVQRAHTPAFSLCQMETTRLGAEESHALVF